MSHVPLAVLFDLDATLFDYSSLRIEATAGALDGIARHPRETSMELFELLRPPLTEILVHFGCADLRREWDSPEALALAVAMENEPGREALLALAKRTEGFGFAEENMSLAHRRRIRQYAAQLRGLPEAEALLRAIAEARAPWGASLSTRSRGFRKYIETNARLAPGGREILAWLRTQEAEVHVVSEGNSAVQTFKFHSLGLADLAQSCVVTDATCGVLPLLDHFFSLDKDGAPLPEGVEELYDQLAPFTVKSSAFFCRLLHGIMSAPAPDLRECMKPFRFLTRAEWSKAPARRAAMIGDRYRKDLEPLLRASPIGVHAFRLVTGRYRAEDPLHEILEQSRPSPSGFFPDLESLRLPLAAALREPGEPISWPAPPLPDPVTIHRVLAGCLELAPDVNDLLKKIAAETLRHKDA